MINSTHSGSTINPTEGLVQYIQAIKPYHTKILDVLIEYVYTEAIDIAVRENATVVLDMINAPRPSVYQCDQGWNINTPPADSTLMSKIISAVTQDPTPIDPDPLNLTYHPYSLSNSFLIEPSTSVVWNGSTYNSLLSYEFSVTHMQSGRLQLTPAPDYPSWSPGMKVTVSASGGGTLPLPLNNNATYYFIPSATLGVFNLAYVPHPVEYNDYVRMDSIGSGTILIQRAESFLVGTTVQVSSTANNSNNQLYSIIKTVAEGVNIRVFVADHITRTTPNLWLFDGTMTQLDVPVRPSRCLPVQASDLFASAIISERIEFNFSFSLSDMVSADVSGIRPVGYGIDLYSQGTLGSHNNTQSINDMAPGSGPNDTYVAPDGFDLNVFDLTLPSGNKL